MKFTSISRAGGREVNEDYIGKACAGNIHCFAVSDGLGNAGNGKLSAEAAVEAVLDAFMAAPEISDTALYSYMLCAQNSLTEQNRKKSSSPTAALVVLLTDGHDAIWGHIGDSRLYRFEKNRIQEITDDHSVAFAAFLSGKCLYDDIRTSPDNSSLLRVLGVKDRFNPQISPVTACSAKTAFLLCSDGFWKYVSEDMMESALKSTSGSKAWLLKMLDEIRKNAPLDNDNYSAVAITLS